MAKKTANASEAKVCNLEVREGRYHLIVDGVSVFDSANKYYASSKKDLFAPNAKYTDKTAAAVSKAGGANLERLAEDNPALAFPINQRFEFVEDLVEMVATKKVSSAIITGEGGLGKSHTVIAALKKSGLRDVYECASGTPAHKTYTVVKGFSTAKGLYKILFENKNSLVVFDDCDSVLQDADALQLLKAALDSYDKRVITWNTSAKFDDGLPRSFQFSGGAIFISNLSQTKIDQAVRTRAMCVDLSMSADQKITRMEHIVTSPDFLPELSTSIKKDALELLKEYKDTARDLSLRSLISVARIRANKTASTWRDLAIYMLVN